MWQSFYKLFPSLKRTPILNRICFYSFCFSSALVVLVVLAKGVSDFRDDREKLRHCLVAEAESHLTKLAALVWTKDSSGIETYLQNWPGLCRLNYGLSASSVYQSIQESDGTVITIGEPLENVLSVESSLPIHFQNYEGEEYWLGEFIFGHHTNELYDRAVEETLGFMLVHVIIIGGGAVLGVVLGYFMFFRRVSRFLKGVQDRNIRASLRSEIEHDQTELTRLWQVFFDLIGELDDSLEKCEKYLEESEQAKQKVQQDSEAKSQFLAQMSHEFRTPMNGLLGFTALLQETALNDEQREYAHTIQISLESLLHVVNDVLDLSRIESGELHVSAIPFNLRSVISEVTALGQKRAQAKGLKLEGRVSPDIPPMFKGDPVRIRQIVLNLMSNAIEHTESGYVLINLETTTMNGAEGIRISIEDTGNDPELRMNAPNDDLGINAFSSELRARRSLGLDVCYQLAELMGSSIEKEVKEGQGNTFWIDLILPIVKQDALPEPIALGVLKELNVLVVDSYELSRQITLELLQDWGISFRVATSMSEALERLKDNDIQLGGINMVLCDDLLQDVAGMEACAQIRSITPKEMRIVVLSSNPQLGDAEGFYLSGANGFVSKRHRDPFLKPIMCRVFAERYDSSQATKRLITRYTISDEAALSEGKHPELGLMNGSVLVVEDNIVNQQLAAKLLEKKGFTVDIAANGFEAIELFKNNRYRMIFMDCLMPDMNGYETTQIIRELEKSNESLGRTPIVALTANAIAGEAERCFKVGMDEFVTKPFKLTKLEMVLERYIN